MAEEREGIFRKQAVEKMASPERLDELIRIVSPKSWLLLSTALAMAVCVLGWCIYGQLPTTVSGQGILVRPRKIAEIQSQIAGRLVSFNLRVGAEVHKGEVLGLVDQAEIRKQLETDRARLAELEAQDREKSALQNEQTGLLGRDVESQRKYLLMQSASRAQSIKDAEALAPVLKKRLDAVNEAIKQGIEARVSSEQLEAQKQYLENQTRISDLQAQLGEIESQIKQLDTKKTELARTLFEASTSRKNQMLELRKSIALYQVQLEKNTQILAAYSGRVVELAANLGQVVNAGARLAYLELAESSDDLVCVSYFPVRDGKRVRPGMKIQVTPDTVKRERFGGIIGTVSSVSSFPVTKEGASLLLGNPEVAARFLKDEPQIEVVAQLERNPATYSGYKWSSSKGPQLAVTAGTTTSGRVTVEMRAPVTYVFPFLRAASGVD